MQSTIGYVSSNRTQTTGGSQADVNLSSGVELAFRTNYVPLNRLAGVGGIERIRVNTINPDPEATRLSSERTAQRSAEQADLAARRASRDDRPRASQPGSSAPSSSSASSPNPAPGRAASPAPAHPAATAPRSPAVATAPGLRAAT
ncbi:hypothetical protein [Burkholderia territorii]|uniref:Uncharacterized protein n=1 Tax=Burkholderia territorii TaxID=1503055 RepID=A0A6L3NM31_9BURK|nr:hypothetical protein [Burkholderia territorii]KAB0685162.1 hypothetical protein F7R13_05610 [Burkholderia territorii]MBM2775796.1 hypothetical protein [Burkholderia territorii]